MDSSIYFRFRAAIDGMAVSSEPIQERVAHAFIHLIPLNADELPGEIQQDFTDLYDRLTRVEDAYLGSVLATARQMNQAEAEEIAHQIVHMLDIVTAKAQAF